MSNRTPLPPPALTQHPSGNVYFSPQQMQEHADKVRREALIEGYDAGFDTAGDGWNGEHPMEPAARAIYESDRAEFLADATKGLS